MSKRNIWFIVSLVTFMAAIALLATGSPWLELTLLKDPYLPLGTLSTWFGMIAIPLAIYWGSRVFRHPENLMDRFLAKAIKAVLFLAVLWGPICFLLAGNLAFNFSEVDRFQGGQTAMRWFWRYSYGIPIASITLLFTYWIHLLLQRLRRNS